MNLVVDGSGVLALFFFDWLISQLSYAGARMNYPLHSWNEDHDRPFASSVLSGCGSIPCVLPGSGPVCDFDVTPTFGD